MQICFTMFSKTAPAAVASGLRLKSLPQTGAFKIHFITITCDLVDPINPLCEQLSLLGDIINSVCWFNTIYHHDLIMMTQVYVGLVNCTGCMKDSCLSKISCISATGLAVNGLEVAKEPPTYIWHILWQGWAFCRTKVQQGCRKCAMGTPEMDTLWCKESVSF